MPNPVIDDLKRQVEASVTVIDSATTLITGIADRVTLAVNEAMRNGATAAELVPVTDLVTALKKETDELSDAILANTPSTP